MLGHACAHICMWVCICKYIYAYVCICACMWVLCMFMYVIYYPFPFHFHFCDVRYLQIFFSNTYLYAFFVCELMLPPIFMVTEHQCFLLYICWFIFMYKIYFSCICVCICMCVCVYICIYKESLKTF